MLKVTSIRRVQKGIRERRSDVSSVDSSDTIRERVVKAKLQ